MRALWIAAWLRVTVVAQNLCHQSTVDILLCVCSQRPCRAVNFTTLPLRAPGRYATSLLTVNVEFLEATWRAASIPQHFVALSNLYLRDTNLREIEEGIFTYMSRLKILDIAVSPISILPEDARTLLGNYRFQELKLRNLTFWSCEESNLWVMDAYLASRKTYYGRTNGLIQFWGPMKFAAPPELSQREWSNDTITECREIIIRRTTTTPPTTTRADVETITMASSRVNREDAKIILLLLVLKFS